MTKIIGLTGGIGSGKTMVANYIKSLGYSVYFADEEAKKILDTEEVIISVKKQFGNDIITNNKIDKDKLSKIVFNNPYSLKQLNAIIHPLVKKHFEKWINGHSNELFVFKEAAILFESGSYKQCDYIITITAPIETRIQRVINRDNTSEDAVLKRIKNQWTDEQRIAKSDFVIENISMDDTQKKVEEILKILKNK